MIKDLCGREEGGQRDAKSRVGWEKAAWPHMQAHGPGNLSESISELPTGWLILASPLSPTTSILPSIK